MYQQSSNTDALSVLHTKHPHLRNCESYVLRDLVYKDHYLVLFYNPDRFESRFKWTAFKVALEEQEYEKVDDCDLGFTINRYAPTEVVWRYYQTEDFSVQILGD